MRFFFEYSSKIIKKEVKNKMPVQAVQQTQPTNVNAAQQQPGTAVPEKKSKWWLWLILVIVAIIVAIGIYLWLT